MSDFCTLFDSTYLARALVLYRSLERTGENFTLYAVCFDDRSYRIVSGLQLPRFLAIPVADIETPALLAVKADRTAGEYCWTCTPHVIRHVLSAYSLAEVTYLDADLCFFGRPSALLAEFRQSGASVLITPHRYSPRYDYSDSCGIFCVQFMTFRADHQAETILQWWGERCLEWCHGWYEPGRFGDQKYLDDWPSRFEGVHVLQHLGGGVAPWNVQQYRVGMEGGALCVNGIELVFYHFSDYRYYRDGVHDFGMYQLSRAVVDLIYRPYAHELIEAQGDISMTSPGFDAGWTRPPRGWKSRMAYGRRFVQGAANRYRVV